MMNILDYIANPTFVVTASVASRLTARKAVPGLWRKLVVFDIISKTQFFIALSPLRI